MKKRYKIEIILIALFIVAFIMKLLHIMGSNKLMVITLMGLAGLYFVGGYFLFNDVKFSLKKIENKLSAKRIMFSIAFGMALSTVAVGLLFKLMLWQGADIQLSGSLVLIILPMLFIMLYIQFKKLDVDAVKHILLRGIIGIIVGLLMLNISNVSIVNAYYRDMPEYKDAMLKVLENPNDREAQEVLKSLRE